MEPHLQRENLGHVQFAKKDLHSCQEELIDLAYTFKSQHKVDHDSDILRSSNTAPIDERGNKTMESVTLENDQKVSKNYSSK